MKRFYKDVGVTAQGAGWQVMLDARPLRTQLGGQQIVPTAAMAELLAGEWRAQGEKINPRSFVFRDLADFALDIVRPDRAAAIGKLLDYAGTDTLCYRADPDEHLYRRQQELWEPLVKACEARHGVNFTRVSGIIHRAQGDETIATLRERLEGKDDFTLASLVTLASIAASLIVPLAVVEDGADVTTLFAAANAEEDWQAELWGWDEQAETVRAQRLEAFVKAAEFSAAVQA